MVKKKTTGKGGKSRMTAIQLFKLDFISKKSKKGKFTTMEDVEKNTQEAWRKLSNKERIDYIRKAKEERDHRGGPSSIKEGELRTRCSPKQFVEVAAYVRDDESLSAKAAKIGFDKILEVSCTKMHHELCKALVKAIDPGTSSICIRNCRQKIDEDIVQELMGLPNEGEEVVNEGNGKNNLFQELNRKFRKKRFSEIKEMIISREEDDIFEPMLVLYTLGTLLCPPKNGSVSNRLLKMVCCEKSSLGSYNWCKFLVNEVMREVSEYKNAINQGVKSKYIGGCIYFLMIMFFQKFPLFGVNVPSCTDALQYWDDTKVNEMVRLENDSEEGILFSHRTTIPDSTIPTQNTQCNSTKSDTEYTLNLPDVKMFKEPKIRQMYCRIMGTVGQTVAAELLKFEQELQPPIRRDGNVKFNVVLDDSTTKSHAPFEPEGEEGSNFESKRKGNHKSNDEPEEEHLSRAEEFEVYQCEDEEEASKGGYEGHLHLRRSVRIIRPAIHSPFVSEIGKVGQPTEKE